LLEKEDGNALPKAKAAATIWEYSFRMLQAYFENATGQLFATGLKVMVKVTVQYHSLYGLSLNIVDIEPTYTVGSMAIQRRNTIAQLKSDGIFDMNRNLPFPVLPQWIAVISSEQAAGYQDFVRQLSANNYGYGFAPSLFPSLMQGEKAAQNIMDALDRINDCVDAFDLVVIIRGGGAVSDLMCFDDYTLASYVAQFPLPILTGIGHDKDESVVDMVAHRALKTPTAVADFLINCMAEEESSLKKYGYMLGSLVQDMRRDEMKNLHTLRQELFLLVQQQLQQENFNLQLYSHDIESHNPYHILSCGYAIVRFRGKTLSNAATVQTGDDLHIILHRGDLHAVVHSK
jgi:exodeoxyribonuclease VII large subunit